MLPATYIPLAADDWSYDTLSLDRPQACWWKLGWNGPVLWKYSLTTGEILLEGRGAMPSNAEIPGYWEPQQLAINPLTGGPYIDRREDDGSTRISCLHPDTLALAYTSQEMHGETVSGFYPTATALYVTTLIPTGPSGTGGGLRLWSFPLLLGSATLEVTVVAPRGGSTSVSNPKSVWNPLALDNDGYAWVVDKRSLYRVTLASGAVTAFDLSGSFAASHALAGVAYDGSGSEPQSLLLLAGRHASYGPQTIAKFDLESLSVVATSADPEIAVWGYSGGQPATGSRSLAQGFHGGGKIWLRRLSDGAFVEWSQPAFAVVRTLTLDGDWGLSGEALERAKSSYTHAYDAAGPDLYLENAAAPVEGNYGVWKLPLYEGIESRLAQLPVERVVSLAPLRLAQLPVERLSGPATASLSQVAVERLSGNVPFAHLDQLVVEAVRDNVEPPPPGDPAARPRRAFVTT
jgi:hypothetical protein